MLFDLPRKSTQSDTSSTEKAKVGSTSVFGHENPTFVSTFTARRAAVDSRREVPDRTKHQLSSSALSAALLKFANVKPTDTDDTEREADDALRAYKRARIDETSTRLEGRSLLSEEGPSTGPCNGVEESATAEIDEDSYWEGAFKQSETQTGKIATEGTSHSARRLLFEYGRRNTRPAPVIQLSKCTTEASASATLPHRSRNLVPVPDASNATGNASEDEDFAIIHRSQATGASSPPSQMSSPELVPSASIAQALTDDRVCSDDEWTML